MSGRPQTARSEEQKDLPEQSITREPEKIKTPARTAITEPPPKSGGEAASPAKRRKKRFTVYLYLLILFGVAFLMLLLAYFVQQRVSENAISDPQDSMTLSREELYSRQSFWTLERHYQAEDCGNRAAVLLMQGQSQYTYRAPDAARQTEIVRAMMDQGVLDEDYKQHPNDYHALLDVCAGDVIYD